MKSRHETGKQVVAVTIALNIILSILKFITGILADSSAMLADALHSLSDILTTVIAAISLKIAHKAEDQEHPYGHEKAESVASKILGTILLLTGGNICVEAIKTFFEGQTEIPGIPALVVAVISIVAKEASYRYTIINARKIKSSALEADALHHRSDALSSIAVLIGISFARAGYPLADPIAAIIVSAFIIKIAIAISIKSIRELIDTSAPLSEVEKIKNTILSVEKVKDVTSLKTRIHGHLLYVDAEILVDHFISVSEGHSIAENVEKTVESKFPEVKHVMVHVNPCDPSMGDLCQNCPHPCR